MRHDPATLLLYRPVNQAELDLIAASDWLAFPPRLPEQPFFYPVLNEQYATQIARDWNVPYYGVGYVLRFALDADYAAQFPVQNVGGREHDELWVPAEELAEFNRQLVGRIEVVSIFGAA
ncbi:ADP-ribosylation/crystallin J1 [Hymenobacter lapidiphilus]|uniref:ADP-ribosylation/crystallin J1 n=1 Tax=Hymenobacter lapidiphilus TaxID=2608003 RepID=A0A7Y7PTB9_9BACT|nr:ADP-ribosylation/crystallin J1 [Hymenobacter lapidiphilus]NVO33302.1 ADP-ribosylation/crystallin J1 [Hymenobacter lapidiphilus]